MNISERIKKDTRPAHQALEKQVISRIKLLQDKQDYIRLLQLFYGYFHPVEQSIHAHLHDGIVPQYTQRRKSQWLLQDLAALGSNSVPDTSGQLPAIDNAAQAMGAMYVLEGSTLGGKIISKMIEKQLSLSSDEALSFFKGYGDTSEDMWQSFTTALSQFPVDEAQEQEIIDAADRTFKKFLNWVELNALTAQK